MRSRLKGASDEAAMQLAQREKAAVKVGGVSLNDKDDVLASVLIDLSQNAALSASLDVGDNIAQQTGPGGEDASQSGAAGRLPGAEVADMPSILVETGFISNPAEEEEAAGQGPPGAAGKRRPCGDP